MSTFSAFHYIIRYFSEVKRNSISVLLQFLMSMVYARKKLCIYFLLVSSAARAMLLRCGVGNVELDSS